MKLSRCQCDPDLLQRIPRAWWMRIVAPRRRLYYCRFCRRTMLVPPVLGAAAGQSDVVIC